MLDVVSSSGKRSVFLSCPIKLFVSLTESKEENLTKIIVLVSKFIVLRVSKPRLCNFYDGFRK